MEENQRPLSDFISSVEQVDAPEITEQDLGEKPKKKGGSKGFTIVVIVLLVLILGMGGYYVYNNYILEPVDDTTTTDVEEETLEEDGMDLLTEVLVPDEAGGEGSVFELSIPEGWSINEDIDYAAVITNDSFSIYIIKNPIITGGGWGFMYDGVSGYETLVSSLVVNGENVNKVTHVLLKDVINNTDLENVFGGSVFASQDGNVTTPTLELNGEKYLIKYIYEAEQVISVDNQLYIEVVGVMDNIVESIIVK